MWKLTEINIRNIVSFHEASLTIKQGVATLIFGKNEDNAAQPCNGSGKSSLIEAISFALTGEQLRKVKSVEEIINDLADEAYVYVRLDNDFNDTTFTIERTISRNGPQVIECHKYNAEGAEIERDKTIQPTVNDYNKFILGEIGLTKDDIYNNYILCDNKYESFFDCSDKNKKEVINRFSNGVIVDESIVRVQADMEPVAARLTEANNKVINLRGSISAIENELLLADEKAMNAKQDRINRIARLDDKILQCREDIELAEDKKSKGEKRLAVLKQLQQQVTELESSEISIHEAYHQIQELCTTYELGAIKNYDELSEQYKEDMMTLTLKASDLDKQIKQCIDHIEQHKQTYTLKYESYSKVVQTLKNDNDEDGALIEKIKDEINKIELKLDKIESQIKQNKSRQAELDTLIARNSAMVNGAVTCPNCQHKFILNYEKTLDEVKNDLAQFEAEKECSLSETKKLTADFNKFDNQADNKATQMDELARTIKARTNQINDEYSCIRDLSKAVDEEECRVSSMQSRLINTENEIDKLNGKIDVLRNRLFGEITGILEGRVMNGEGYISQQLSSIQFLKGQMAQYQQSKRDLVEAPETDFSVSLKASLDRYRDELSDAEITVSSVQSEYNVLKEQEMHFTMFKSYIARKKIDALSYIVNDFLEKIGSDIRLKLEGFTVTKTGKLRDKISVQVMRDGVDCGSYHKFSGGEKARLNLACILSLHTLTNSNCEEGKGLDFIIIDELLDKSDEVGMATYCEALNKLSQTALLITQGGVSEAYPHKLLIVKKQGVSTISD